MRARDQDDQLNARIAAYELAYRMIGTAGPGRSPRRESGDLGYVWPEPSEHAQFWRSLFAGQTHDRTRRGFVQVYSGDTNGWDAHSDVLRITRNYGAHRCPRRCC